MKPWPEALTKLYQLPPETINPERPWWKGRNLDEARRGDGAVIRITRAAYTPTPLSIATIMESKGAWGGRTAVLEGPAQTLDPTASPNALSALVRSRMESLDAIHPLPHPGVRVGQVWAFETREGLVVAQLTSDTRGVTGKGLLDPEVTFSETIPMPEDAAGVRSSVGTFEADERAVFSIQVLKGMACYLLADPCCPWLAPWAPAERP